MTCSDSNDRFQMDGAHVVQPVFTTGSRRPAFLLAVALVGGSVLGSVVATPPYVTFALMLLTLAFALACGWLGRRPEAWRSRAMSVRLSLAVFFLLALGRQQADGLRFEKAEAIVRDYGQRSGVWMRGVVVDEPVARKDDAGFRVTLGRVLVGDGAEDMARLLPRRVQLTVTAKAWPGSPRGWPLPGEGFEVQARPEAPPRSVHATLFDHGAWLRSRGIGAVATVRLPGSIRPVNEPASPVLTFLCRPFLDWRRATIERLENLLGPARSAVMAAMLVGDTSGLDAPTRRVFMCSGVAHLFAVSGLHTAMLAALVFGLFRLLKMPPRPAAWALIAFLAAYALVVGFRAPVVRASIMVGCLCIPFIARRAVDSLNALSIAVCVVLLADPAAPFRVDFQFSYLCALSMIVLRPALAEILTLPLHGRAHPILGKRGAYVYNVVLGSGLTAVVATQFAVAPLAALYFHRISIIALLSNLVMVPLGGVLLALGWVFALLAPLGPGLEVFFAGFLRAPVDLFLWLGEVFSLIPGASLATPAFPWWLSGIWYLALFQGAPVRMRRSPGAREVRRASMVLRLAALTALLVWWPVAARMPLLEEPVEARLVMLDVGQGDCMVLQGPTGRRMAIDTGRPGSAETLLRYLEGTGDDRLTALVLTHFDLDHVGATADIVEALEVGRVFVGSEWGESIDQQELRRTLTLQAIPVVRLRRGDVIQGLGVPVKVLSPAERTLSEVSSNEQSLVLRVDAGAIDFLLMGDAGEQVEAWLAEVDGPEVLDVDVLKVGHHGSRTGTTTEFLRATTPLLALVSAGRTNQYGHPAPEVVQRLEQAGARILNTQVHGTVEIVVHGRGLSVRAARFPDE